MEFFSSICFLMAYIYIADPDSETRLKLQQYFSVQGFSVEGFSLLADQVHQFAPFFKVQQFRYAYIKDRADYRSEGQLQPIGGQHLDYDPDGHAHGQGEQQDVEQVTHLGEVAVADQFLCIIGVVD